METEPLQDTLPPRYAIESDDSEDEGDAILKRSVPKPEPNVVLEWSGLQPKQQPLIVALDRAGKQWSDGIELGDVQGRVCVNDVEVASAFGPSWAQVTIVLVHLRLPLNAMHTFASMVIRTIRPTSVVIIDAYAVPAYVHSSTPPSRPPIRYLRTTAAAKDDPPNDVDPFDPPNLIQSPAASFLAILESRTRALPATLLLLPSAHIPPPAPSDIGSHAGPDVYEEWENSTLVELHQAVTALASVVTPWSVLHARDRSGSGRRSRRGDIGEGGMYI